MTMTTTPFWSLLWRRERARALVRNENRFLPLSLSLSLFALLLAVAIIKFILLGGIVSERCVEKFMTILTDPSRRSSRINIIHNTRKASIHGARREMVFITTAAAAAAANRWQSTYDQHFRGKPRRDIKVQISNSNELRPDSSWGAKGCTADRWLALASKTNPGALCRVVHCCQIQSKFFGLEI